MVPKLDESYFVPSFAGYDRVDKVRKKSLNMWFASISTCEIELIIDIYISFEKHRKTHKYGHRVSAFGRKTAFCNMVKRRL